MTRVGSQRHSKYIYIYIICTSRKKVGLHRPTNLQEYSNVNNLLYRTEIRFLSFG